MPRVNHWIISDTHFGHSNILRHCRRPADADHRIAQNWRRLVNKDDVLIHLGDVSWSCFDLPALLTQLPGKKLLVRGNHDKKTASYYLEAGFNVVCYSIVISQVLLTHEPVSTKSDEWDVNLHGHLHNNVPEGHRAFPWCRLFALEYTNYEPRLLEKAIK